MKNDISLKPTTGSKNDSFVGVKITDNKVVFHYPEACNFPEADSSGNIIDEKGAYKKILKIIKTLCLTKKSSSNDVINTRSDSEYETPILSMLWLINDYLTYHQYINREKNFLKDTKGKISWKKTMRQIPFVQDTRAVYPVVFSVHYLQKDDIIVDIYKYCVSDAINKIGWIYNLHLDDYLKSKKYKFNESTKKMFLGVLRIELNKTFEDVKKIRLKHMINVIKGLDSEALETNQYVLGVDSYEYVFEAMLRNMLSDVERIKDFYPSAEWYVIQDDQTKNSSNLRPDIVMLDKNNKKAYILDAKYYRYGITAQRSDLPDSTSIQKQITYSEYLKNSEYLNKKLKGYSVYSAFVMPYNKSKNSFNIYKNLAIVGIATAPWDNSDAKSKSINNKVIGLLIDLEYLIDNWSLYNLDAVETLSNLIIQATRLNKFNKDEINDINNEANK